MIAEVGVNHNGDPELAEACIRAAAAAGADAVKFQTFRAELLADAQAPLAPYQERNGQGGQDQRAMLRALELDLGCYPRLRSLAESLGLVFLSTPFDRPSLEFLVRLGVPALKLGSGDLDNFPLLAAARASGLPLIVSTGMADLREIADTVAFLSDKAAEFALLQCVSAYPAAAEAQNVRSIPALAKRFGVPVGFSDHTSGVGAAAAAVALGACIVEKHITLDRSLPGPDHLASLEPDGFKDYVLALREAQASLGAGEKQVQPQELEVRAVARRSAVALRDLPAGEALALDAVDMRRPADGVSGRELLSLLGRRLVRPVAAGERLRATDFELSTAEEGVR